MIEDIFFDLGGVFFQDFFSGGAEFFANKLRLPAQKVADVYKATDNAAYCKVQMTDEERWGLFAEKMDIPEERVPSFIQTFYESYQLFPEAILFLEKFKQKHPLIDLGILSDQPLGVAEYLRKKFPNFFSLFNEKIITISAEVLLSKKDQGQAIYKEALQRSGKKPNNVLFVDNSIYNIKDAKLIGLQTFYFDITNKPITGLLKELEELLN